MAIQENGVVKWFSHEKGFGVITRERGGDAFVHFKAIKTNAYQSLSKGQRVAFAMSEGQNGLQAEEVTVID